MQAVATWISFYWNARKANVLIKKTLSVTLEGLNLLNMEIIQGSIYILTSIYIQLQNVLLKRIIKITLNLLTFSDAIKLSWHLSETLKFCQDIILSGSIYFFMNSISYYNIWTKYFILRWLIDQILTVQFIHFTSSLQDVNL